MEASAKALERGASRRAFDGVAEPRIARVWPPLAAFVVATLALGGVGWVYGFDPLSAATWAHWDSKSYMDIARHGLTFHRCGAHEGFLNGHHYVYCGNAGWFPLYPLLMALFGSGQTDLAPVGVAISLAFTAGMLGLLWNGLLGGRLTTRNLVALGFAAFVPGVVFHHAVFPMAMAGFFALLCVVMLSRDRWWAAGLAGCAGAATYPTGVIMAAVAGIWLLFLRPDLALRARVRAAQIAGGLTCLGLVAVLLAMQAQTGAWYAYFRIQDQVRSGLDWPMANFLYGIALAPWRPGPHGTLDWASVQGDLVALLVVGLALHTWRRRAVATRLELMVAVYAVLFWFLPLTQGGLSWHRQDAMLVPLALLLRRVDLRISIPVVVAFVAISLGTTLAFFQNLLV